ncbi:uncharacterized protein LOC135848586 [Planococcus citri]|uniref:uncharacterized protein LOC135848586 n=1 Tax=Planococcus citri TaxID=170843 RepID=UPI0031F74A89
MTSTAGQFYYDCQQLRYWFGSLTNQQDEMIVFNGDLVSTCELIFGLCATMNNRSAMEYFWNRIQPDKRLEKATDMLDKDDTRKCLARFILLKLDDQQLGEFVDEYGGLLMSELLSGEIDADDGIVIIPTWMYIRNFMNKKQFLDLSKCMLELLASHDADNNQLFFCREIWNSAPHNLKQSAVTKILSSTELLDKLSSLGNDGMKSTPKLVKFLLNILPSATFDERSSFWNNCWHCLIEVARCKYLQQFMKLCFRNEDQIAEFKANVMANSKHLSQSCNSLVKVTNFKKLNDLLKFCYPEAQQARNRKQELLQLVLLGEDCQFGRAIVQNAYRLNEFINETYDGADLSAEFKNLLVMSPAFEKFVSLGVLSTDIYDLFDIKNFVDEIQLTEQTLVQIKTRIIDSFKESLTGDGSSRNLSKERGLNYFLSWCLGSDAEVQAFRRNNALL